MSIYYLFNRGGDSIVIIYIFLSLYYTASRDYFVLLPANLQKYNGARMIGEGRVARVGEDHFWGLTPL